MSSPTDICTRMISIMHSSSEFSALTGYTIGIFPYIPIADRYAVCQLVVTDSLSERRETTNVDRIYTGQAIFEVLAQDVFALTGTPAVATATSYTTAVNLCLKFMKVFDDEDNRSLNNLTLANGGIVQRIELDQNIEFIPTVNRENNHINQGTCTFQVITKEPAT